MPTFPLDPLDPMLVIDGLARPDMLIEVEAWAAKG